MRSKEAIRLRILQLCGERDITINALARMSGITQSTINNITCGRNNSTTIATLLKICDGLEMPLPEFFNCELFQDLEQEVV